MELYQAEEFQQIENSTGFFIKFFLLNANRNINGWRVADNAIKEYMADFKGKPFIIMPNLSHPHPENASDMFEAQAPYKKGEIIEVGFDAKSGKAWAIAQITDTEAQDMIRSGKVRYVSASMIASDEDVSYRGTTPTITKFQAAHVAGVGNPAYGVMDAQIKGTCQAGKEECRKQLMMIQASIEGNSSSSFNNNSDTEDQMSSTEQQLLQADIAKMKSEISKLSEDVKTYSAKNEALEKENASLKESFQAEQKKPYITSIIESKKVLGLNADKDTEELQKLGVDQLKLMQAEFATLAKSKSNVQDARYPAAFSASVDHEDQIKKSKNFLDTLHGRYS
jgi:FtsZ-binding cell division protein ZapB